MTSTTKEEERRPYFGSHEIQTSGSHSRWARRHLHLLFIRHAFELFRQSQPFQRMRPLSLHYDD